MTERMPAFPFGYWEHPLDYPDTTVAKDKAALEKMELVAASAKPVVNEDLLGRIKRRIDADEGIGKGIDLRYILAAIYGYVPEWPAQVIGSCVASGSMRAVLVRTFWEILVLGELDPIFGKDLLGTDSIAPFAPYHYRAGRRHAGINGYSDGSTCAGQIKGLMSQGLLDCSTDGLDSVADHFPEPSGRIYREWGKNDALMQKYEEEKACRLAESARPESTNQIWEFLTEHFKPMMICSSWGFRPDYQHAADFWVYRQAGTWPHNMTIAGCRQESDGRYFMIWNSWGTDAHKDGPLFWVNEDTMSDWLLRANVQTIGNLIWEETW